MGEINGASFERDEKDGVNVMSSIRDNLTTIDGENLSPSQLRSMGFPVFLSSNAIDSQETIFAIGEYWRSIHATAYGQMLPSTSTKIEHTPTIAGAFETVFNPGANQTIVVQAVEIQNSSLAPVNFQVGCADVACYLNVVDPSATKTVPVNELPKFSNGQGALAFNQVDGAVGDLTVKFVYSFTLA